MNDNICKFSPTRSIEEAINIINFVFETKSEFSKKFSITATYAIYLVTEGSGRLHTTQTDFGLKRGDLFFTMPSKPFYIENEENLQFIYITFFGWRATSLLERLNIIDSSPIPEDFSFLIPFWQKSLKLSNSNNIDIVAESVILHTCSYLCGTFQERAISPKNVNIIFSVKKFVDENYSDIDLTLKSVSAHFSYNAKYISDKFLKTVGTGFNAYLTQLRLEHAILLMENGFKNIQEIAGFSGFRDPLYFSRVFKKFYHVSPREYISKIQN